MKTNQARYEVEPSNGFFSAIASMSEFEIKPGNTISFFSETDLTQIERIRNGARNGHRPSYTAFIVKAVALALHEFPYANRRVFRIPFLGRRIQKFFGTDVTVACERDVPNAPMATFVDILRDAKQMTLADITGRLHDLAVCDVTTNKQWREFSAIITRLPRFLTTWLLRLPVFSPKFWVKYRGGAVLVSSPSKYGVDVVGGTWPWPLGVSFGLVKERPVVRHGEIVPCPTFTLTLNWDRRVMAGAQAARFFKRIVDILENAETEMKADLPEEAPKTEFRWVVRAGKTIEAMSR
ncbi:MAG: 2-oxo acid dehydrogenase subunit E2 [Planctomycetota bacterium]